MVTGGNYFGGYEYHPHIPKQGFARTFEHNANYLILMYLIPHLDSDETISVHLLFDDVCDVGVTPKCIEHYRRDEKHQYVQTETHGTITGDGVLTS